MENDKKEYLSRRDFMKAAAIASGAFLLNACQPAKSYGVKLSDNLNHYEPEVIPTATVDTPLDPEVVKKEIDNPLFFGEYDMSKTPFSITIPEEMSTALGFIKESGRVYTADMMLPALTENSFYDINIKEEFEKGATHHGYIDGGNRVEIFWFDLDKLCFYSHSYQDIAPVPIGQLVWRIAGQLQKFPQTSDSFFGPEIQMTLGGRQSFKIKLMDLITIPEKVWHGDDKTPSPLGQYVKGEPIFYRTDRLGIKDYRSPDDKPGTRIFMIESCNSLIPGSDPHTLFQYQKSEARSIAVFKGVFA